MPTSETRFSYRNELHGFLSLCHIIYCHFKSMRFLQRAGDQHKISLPHDGLRILDNVLSHDAESPLPSPSRREIQTQQNKVTVLVKNELGNYSLVIERGTHPNCTIIARINLLNIACFRRLVNQLTRDAPNFEQRERQRQGRRMPQMRRQAVHVQPPQGPPPTERYPFLADLLQELQPPNAAQNQAPVQQNPVPPVQNQPAPQNAAPEPQEAPGPSRATRDEAPCVICLGNLPDTICYSCGHQCMCQRCASTHRILSRGTPKCPVMFLQVFICKFCVCLESYLQCSGVSLDRVSKSMDLYSFDKISFENVRLGPKSQLSCAKLNPHVELMFLDRRCDQVLPLLQGDCSEIKKRLFCKSSPKIDPGVFEKNETNATESTDAPAPFDPQHNVTELQFSSSSPPSSTRLIPTVPDASEGPDFSSTAPSSTSSFSTVSTASELHDSTTDPRADQEQTFSIKLKLGIALPLAGAGLLSLSCCLCYIFKRRRGQLRVESFEMQAVPQPVSVTRRSAAGPPNPLWHQPAVPGSYLTAPVLLPPAPEISDDESEIGSDDENTIFSVNRYKKFM